MNQISKKIKILILGPKNSGKTHILNTYTNKAQIQGIPKSDGLVFIVKQFITRNKLKLKLQIWDCPGDSNKNLIKHHLKTTKGVILFFNPNNRDSLHELRQYIQLIKASEMEEAPKIFLIQNNYKQKLIGDEAIGQFIGENNNNIDYYRLNANQLNLVDYTFNEIFNCFEIPEKTDSMTQRQLQKSKMNKQIRKKQKSNNDTYWIQKIIAGTMGIIGILFMYKIMKK